MAKYKNKKKKIASAKEVDLIEENVDDEEIDEEIEEEEEELEEEVIEEVEDDEEDDDSEEENDEYEEVPLEERLANIEKKTNITFWLVIVILVLVALNMLFTLNGNSNSEEGATDTTTSDTTQSTSGYDTSAFNKIEASDIKSLSDGKTIVVWLGYQGCGYCQAYAPVLAEVTKDYGITANYIDVATLTNEGLETITSLTGSGEWKEFASTFTGTPFTLIIKNNKVVGGYKGAVKASQIEEAFGNAGIKK